MVDVVPGENEHLIGRVRLDEVKIPADGIRCTLIPVAVLGSRAWRQNLHTSCPAGQVPGLTGAEVTHQGERLVLGQHPYFFQTGVGHIAETEIDYPVYSAERHSRFGPALDKNIQATSNPTCK